MSKVNIDARGLKLLAVEARKNGTQDKFIDLALDWAEQAESIALGYRSKIEELEIDILEYAE